MSIHFRRWRKKLLLLLLLCVMFFGMIWGVGYLHGSAASLGNMLPIVRFYIEQHGSFPESFSEWENSGYLRKISTERRFYYQGRTAPLKGETERWSVFASFEDFVFAYGVKVDQLELREDRLFDKTTGERVFLVKGPCFWLARPIYNEYSVEFYELMRKTGDRETK